MIPQTLNYADGGIRVAGLPDQAHPPRGTTARMADFARIEAQTRPMTTKTVSLMETRKLDVSVDPQNAPPPPPGAPAIAALGTMNLGTGSAVPAWVAFDGQTLNFEAFFVQPAVDGRDRVRRCVLRFYLEDGTADVCEPKTDNSGLAQGRLLKRHKAVNGATGAPLTHRDFVVGGSLKLYGVDYAVVACDAFTREFLTREGIDVAPDSTTPPALIDEGPGVLGTIGMGVRGVGGRKVYDPSEFPPPAADADDAVGDERDPRTDAFDRRVLRFFCSWKDGSERDSESETCHYTLNYFLRDGTVEVLEDSGPHAQGRDPFPKMLARSRGRRVRRPRARRAREAPVPQRGRHQGRRDGRRVRPRPRRARLRRVHAGVLREGVRADARGDGAEARPRAGATAEDACAAARRLRLGGRLAQELRVARAATRAVRLSQLRADRGEGAGVHGAVRGGERDPAG
jgi:hypothetical protein